MKTQDPAGLDQLLMAAGKGMARFFEARLGSIVGQPITLWDGADGLGAVLAEHIKAAGVPNKRLPELLTPRAVVQRLTPAQMETRINRRMRRRRAAR